MDNWEFLEITIAGAPSPSETDTTLHHTVDWTGVGTPPFSFYYGTTYGSLNLGQSGITTYDFTFPSDWLDYNTIYYWQIYYGTTYGTVYAFQTISFLSPPAGELTTRLVAAANNKIWYEST